MAEPAQDPTETLVGHASGDADASARLISLVYDQLHALAVRYMRGERRDHTLQPTALVHEAYVRMIDGKRVDWNGRTHFFAVAARQMRRVLVDHARRARADKRGGALRRVTLDDDIARQGERVVDAVALDEALRKLALRNERRGRIAELRLFAGLEVTEVARLLGISPTTVKEEWRVARARLHRELRPGSDPTRATD